MTVDWPIKDNKIQSYVANRWLVSTIYRESSAMESDVWYHETLVWEWDSETKELGEIIYQSSGLMGHFVVCKALMLHGAQGLNDLEDS